VLRSCIKDLSPLQHVGSCLMVHRAIPRVCSTPRVCLARGTTVVTRLWTRYAVPPIVSITLFGFE
jgi:hypothetical protein